MVKRTGINKWHIIIGCVLVIVFVFYSLADSGFLQNMGSHDRKESDAAGRADRISDIQQGQDVDEPEVARSTNRISDTPQKIGGVDIESGKIKEVDITVVG